MSIERHIKEVTSKTNPKLNNIHHPYTLPITHVFQILHIPQYTPNPPEPPSANLPFKSNLPASASPVPDRSLRPVSLGPIPSPESNESCRTLFLSS